MQTIRKSLGLVLIMFVLCGFIFPLTVTLGQVLFPEQANGSLVKQDGKNWFKAHWTTMDRT